MAYTEAQRLARVLQQDFDATEVHVFGSVTRFLKGEAGFHLQSDIDLATRGISTDRFFAAQGHLLMLSSFLVDLIDLDDCSPKLREAILRQGVLLRD